MKIIISRKGFDSGYGGVASPILPDGSMISLPIPGMSYQSYRDIYLSFADMSSLVKDLTKGKITGRTPVHFDPDLNMNHMSRETGWLPSLGQTGSAQGHLSGQQVDKGDIFLFFGWFRQTDYQNDKYIFKPKTPDLHVIFGYLQIGDIIHLGSKPNEEEILSQYPWLNGHPHLYGNRDENNTIYIASEKLTLNGLETNLPGGHSFNKFHEQLCLTAPQQSSRSLWKVPLWLNPKNQEPSLSYHKDFKRWSYDQEGNCFLQSVAKGQEFVIELDDLTEFQDWFLNLQHSNQHKLKL